MKKDIVIFGAGGFAREVLWNLEDINLDKNEWNIVGFLDDNPDVCGKEVNGYPVYNPQQFIEKLKGKCYITNGVGNCFVKHQLADRFRGKNFEYANLVHPSVMIHRTSQLDGTGIIIQPGSIITTNIVIKSHVTINIDVTVGHDCYLDSFSTVAPGVHLSGYVYVGTATDIGTGATVIQGLKIGKECVIGANASVIREIPDFSVAVGVPAKVIKTLKSRIEK